MSTVRYRSQDGQSKTSLGYWRTIPSKPVPRILVVDDDEDIKDLIAPVLGDAGFTVATASNGWDALKILESEDVDLMVTDVLLPEGLNGVELVIYARARYPTLKSLFISGYSDPVQADPAWDDFVAKPFRPRELLGCVYELLSRELPKKPLANPHREALLAMVEAKIASRNQSPGAPDAVRAGSAGRKAVPETGSILVVDDDPFVLDVAAMMIEDLGFAVLRAADGPEALRLLDANSGIMLLVTDIVMPGMDGWALGRAAKQRHPDLKVLYVSGFIKNWDSLPAEEYGPILPKPWRSRQFYEAVSRVMAGL
jgi:CheY-like chemotaxis protein